MVLAGLLVNGATIVRTTATECLTYFDIELDHPDILIAEGAAIECHGGTGNGERPPQPNGELDAARAHLLTHAKRLGFTTTDDLCLHVIAKDRLLWPDKPAAEAKPKLKRGRPRKGELRPPPPPSRIERQRGMTLAAMLADLPRACDVGAKRNAKGFSETWIGYKLHIDTADGEIPISCVLTAASVHDSQVAIPLATITAGRVTNLYDLMDSAYDVAAIKQHSRDLNHVPIIDINPRATPGLKQELAEEAKRLRRVGHRMAEQVGYGERSAAERVNGGLKDNHGGRSVRVQGPDKVMCHLMFGVLSFTVLQLVRLVT